MKFATVKNNRNGVVAWNCEEEFPYFNSIINDARIRILQAILFGTRS
jgi:hypothetical protein